jgi:cytochrome c peroxidase
VASGCSRSGQGELIVLDERTTSTSEARISTAAPSNEEISPRILRRFAVLEPDLTPRSAALIDLGRLLYYEPRLSRTGQISCNSCHLLDRYGTKGSPASTGVDGQTGTRNAPSTFHASGQFVQFWDGRAATIEDQVKVPLVAAKEMGMQPAQAVAVLTGIDGYGTAFAAAFPGDPAPITFDHIAKAIGAFERGLTTPSRWDRYLAADRAALTSVEKEGAKAFANIGCLVCHTGPYIGGSMFEKVGARTPWPDQKDRGRRNVTGDPADDMLFKVPSLRNVAETAPYFHDGSAATLDQAVRWMGQYQLGVELGADEVTQLVAWLGSLTGDLPKEYIAKPVLPSEPQR